METAAGCGCAGESVRRLCFFFSLRSARFGADMFFLKIKGDGLE